MKQFHSNHRDLNKLVLIDKDELEKEKKDKKAFDLSPKMDVKRMIKINNAFFEMKKNETNEQATERLTKTFKHSIL